jgi:hypothetical protein
LLVVPVFYLVFDDFGEFVKRGFRRQTRDAGELREGRGAEIERLASSIGGG